MLLKGNLGTILPYFIGFNQPQFLKILLQFPELTIIGYFRPMLTAKNIYKKYGSLEVLKSVDININKAEIVSIVG